MDLNDIFKYGKVSCKASLSTEQRFTTSIHLIGCGGTGSRLIPLLAQAIRMHNVIIQTNPRHTEYLKGPITLTLYDMDHVTSGNMDRQNFIYNDINKNKAEVLAERISACWGIDVSYIPKKFSKEVFRSNTQNYIFIDCTDNLAARRSIEDIYKSLYNPAVLISGGNEEDFGQAIVSFKHKNHDIKDKIIQLNDIIKNPNFKNNVCFDSLPTLLDLYKDFKDTEEASCDEIVIRHEQSMPINNLVATLIYNMFYHVINGQEFKYHMVKCNLSNIFDTKKINHPQALLDLYLQSLCNSKGQMAIDCVLEWVNGPVVKSFEFVIEFLNKYKGMSLLLVKEFLINSWKLNAIQLKEINDLMVTYANIYP